MTKIIINGAKGKMGKSIVACATNHPNIEVVGQVDVGDDLAKVVADCDVVMDFSSPTPVLEILLRCSDAKKAVVMGTTGHSDREMGIIQHYSTFIPIVKATNFSTGVNVLFWLTRNAAEILGPEFDIEIVETHHRLKKDAPSGTAKTLAGILAEVRNGQFQAKVHDRQRGDAYTRPGREGNLGARDSSEIGIHAIRGGDVVGDHTVMFLANGERVELSHKASSRETFAQGAFRAVEWVVKQPPGLYDMMDVLELK